MSGASGGYLETRKSFRFLFPIWSLCLLIRQCCSLSTCRLKIFSMEYWTRHDPITDRIKFRYFSCEIIYKLQKNPQVSIEFQLPRMNLKLKILIIQPICLYTSNYIDPITTQHNTFSRFFIFSNIWFFHRSITISKWKKIFYVLVLYKNGMVY